MWQACCTKWGMGFIRTSGFFWLVTFLLGIECGQPEHEEFHIGHPSQLAPDTLIFALKDSATHCQPFLEIVYYGRAAV